MCATPEHSRKSHVAPLNRSLIDVCIGSSQTEMYLMEGTQEKPILLIIALHCFTRTNILCGITEAESLTRHYNCRKWSSVKKNGDERKITGWLLEALDGAVSINSSLTTIRGKTVWIWELLIRYFPRVTFSEETLLYIFKYKTTHIAEAHEAPWRNVFFWKNVVYWDSTEPETVIQKPLIYNEANLKGGKLVFV